MNLEIPAKRSRIPFGFFIGILVSAFFLYFFLNDVRTLPFFYYRAFYLGIFIYGAILIIISFLDYIKTIFDKDAKLVLSDKSFTDNLSILSCGPVPWEEVSDVAVKKTKRFHFYYLVVTVSNNDKYLKNKNPVIRYILNIYIKVFGGIVVISQTRIDYDIQKLKQDIIDHWALDLKNDV